MAESSDGFPAGAGPRVGMVDPGCLTPAYDAALSAALLDTGAEVTLLTAPHRRDSAPVYPVNLRVRELFFRGIGLERYPRLRRLLKALDYSCSYRRLMGWLRSRTPDIVHFQWLMLPPLDWWFIKRIRRFLPQSAVIVTVHDVEPLFPVVGRFFMDKALADADGVIVHGDSARERLLQRVPAVNAERVAVIPHGPLHAPPEDQLGQSEVDVRGRLDIPMNQTVGLFFGEIKTYKGIDILARAVASLERKFQEQVMVLVVGCLEDQGCQQAIAELVALRHCCRVELGYVPSSAIPELFTAADFAILPYRRVTQSGVLFTALANGCPVIASDVGEMGNVVREINGGWIVPPDDPEAVRDTLRRVATTDRAALRSYGERVRRRMHQRFGWEAIAELTLQTYEAGFITRRDDANGHEASARKPG